ncbi:MAG: formyl transferase [Planctomycetota bacterium]
MHLGILTSVETRHRFFVNAIRKRWDVVAVGHERTGYSPAVVSHDDLSEKERGIVREHYEERTRQEAIFFGHDSEFISKDDACRVEHIDVGGLNLAATVQWLEESNVDLVVVYGTNLIREPLLSRFAGRMVNMHLGLSPYYRGTATNFYPLLNEEPEHVGATIHLIDPGIDSGAIYRHARPEIVAGDQPHTIGCKAILAGIGAILLTLSELEKKEAEPVRQWVTPNSRLYLRKDFHPRQVVDLHRKMEGGLIERYAKEAAQRCARVKLIREFRLQEGQAQT